MRCLKTVAVVGALSFAMHAESADLIAIYNQALKGDPTYKKAQADWLSASHARTLASVGTGIAGSGLFPNITVSTVFSKDRTNTLGSAGNNITYTDKQYLLTVTQPILNWATWSGMRGAGFSVKSSYATYMAAGQALMLRTATAYLEVLRMNEKLRYTISEKEAVRMELKTTLAQYRVGLVAVTGVYNSQSSYDQQIATEISDRNTLLDRAEDLRAITGVLYRKLSVLPPKLPAIIPAPANQEAWVKIAIKQNYVIKADHFSMLSARQAIRTNWAGLAPTVNAVGTYQHNRYSAARDTTNNRPENAKSGSIGIAMNFPLFQGGYRFVANEQAQAQYLSDSDQLELTYRTTVNNTRQSFLSVQSGITQINADYQSVLAAEKNLEATRKAYLVGTRVMTDVLKAISTLYEAKKVWAGHRYDYVEALLGLKSNAGTLSTNDLQVVNAWMKGSESIDYHQTSYQRDPYYNVSAIGLIRHTGSAPKKHARPVRAKKKSARMKKKLAPKMRVKKVVKAPLVLPKQQSEPFLPAPASMAVRLPSP